MKMISGALTILLMCVQACWLASIGDICQIRGKDLVIHRNYKTGVSLCCLNIRCSRGEEVVICDRDDPWSTTCQSCPDGTYQPEATDSADMLHCYDKTQCRGNLSARHEKSKTKDTRCVCDPKIGFCNPAGVTRNPRSCVKKTCAPGFRLTPNCSCEACVKPENNKREQKPCDKRNRLCRTKRETPSSETQSVAICPEDDDPEPLTEAPTVLERKDNVKKTGLISPPSVVPYFSALISNRASSEDGRDDVTSDYLNADVSRDQVNKSVEWYMYLIFIPVLFAVGLVAVIVCLIIKCKRPHHKSNSTSLIKQSPSAGSNSTGDPEMDEITTTETKTAESLSLMTADTSCTSEASPAVQNMAGAAAIHNGMMKPCDKEKLTARRLFLTENLIFCEYLWAFLQCNGTVTSEKKAQIEKSSSSDSEKAGALITCLLKKDSHAFATFVAALIYTKQKYLARVLDPALTVELEQNCLEDYQLMNYAHELVQSNADVDLGTSRS